MKFYHYNTAKLDVISSRASRDPNIAFGSLDPFDDSKGISLFFEPIPRNLASILHNEHTWWKYGSEWIEHVIDESAIPEEVSYRIVETPIMDQFYNQFDWTTKDKAKRKQWSELGREEMRKNHFIGSKRDDLVKYCRPYVRGIADYYKDMYKLHLEEKADPQRDKDWPDYMKMYAPHVPHVILYTFAKLEVSSRNHIKLT